MTESLPALVRGPLHRTIATRHLAAGTVAVASALVAAGVFVPWLTYYGGLYSLTGGGTTNGVRFLAGAGAGLVLSLFLLARPSRSARTAVMCVGAATLGFAAYLLVQLHSALSGVDAMVVPGIGPGLWLIVGGGSLMFLSILLPLPAGASRPARVTGPHQQAVSLMRRAALRTHAVTWQRGLQLGLGTVWLVDAALQCQPYMFTRSFATSTLAGTARGNPAVVADLVRGVAHVVAAHAFLANEGFVLIQLTLALAIIHPRTVRFGLAASIPWSLAVWVLGEGAGQVVAPHTTPFMGAPGAALLYGVVALLVWPRDNSGAGESGVVAGEGGTRSPLARAAWFGIFVLLALECLPERATAIATGRMLRTMATGEPAWLAALDRGAAGVFDHHGTLVLLGFLLLFAIAGAAVPFVTPLRRPVLLLVIAVSLTIWTLENFGGVLTGSATDVSTGPLLVLLALSFWPARQRTRLRRSGAGTAAVALQLSPAVRT